MSENWALLKLTEVVDIDRCAPRLMEKMGDIREFVPKLSIAPDYLGLDSSHQDYPGCDQFWDNLEFNPSQ